MTSKQLITKLLSKPLGSAVYYRTSSGSFVELHSLAVTTVGTKTSIILSDIPIIKHRKPNVTKRNITKTVL